MYQEGLISTKSDAAVTAEMKEPTFIHRTLGRQSAEDDHKSRRLLKEEEEIPKRRHCRAGRTLQSGRYDTVTSGGCKGN